SSERAHQVARSRPDDAAGGPAGAGADPPGPGRLAHWARLEWRVNESYQSIGSGRSDRGVAVLVATNSRLGSRLPVHPAAHVVITSLDAAFDDCQLPVACRLCRRPTAQRSGGGLRTGRPDRGAGSDSISCRVVQWSGRGRGDAVPGGGFHRIGDPRLDQDRILQRPQRVRRRSTAGSTDPPLHPGPTRRHRDHGADQGSDPLQSPRLAARRLGSVSNLPYPKPVESVLETIGGTPMLRLTRVSAGIRTPIYAKAEFFNPGGSVKDRIGQAI